jgi:hypothetical protein
MEHSANSANSAGCFHGPTAFFDPQELTMSALDHFNPVPPTRGRMPAALNAPDAAIDTAPDTAIDSGAIGAARRRLRPLPHPPEHYDGIPYYDDEFDMAQSPAHSRMVRDLSQFLEQLAPVAGLQVFSDNPIWYWLVESGQQKPFYPDYALAVAAADARRLTALDLRLVIELVSTATAAKERKDSERMRELNAANGVAEFVLFYPEPEDERAVRWFGLDQAVGGYREWALPPDRRHRSVSIPGLEVEVLAREAWRPGRKARLWYRGERLPDVDEAIYLAEQERQAREAAERQNLQERQAREAAEREAQNAREENARLLARLQAAGLAP